jgi:hypothetical protein
VSHLASLPIFNIGKEHSSHIIHRHLVISFIHITTFENTHPILTSPHKQNISFIFRSPSFNMHPILTLASLAFFFSFASPAPLDAEGGPFASLARDPLACGFGEYATTKINNVVGDGPGLSCFGFHGREPSKCGGPWSAKEVADIKTAVREQIAEDGLLTRSTSWGWMAGFLGSTTAFADRDTSVFESELDKVNVDGNLGAGQRAYFWQRGRDMLWVGRARCTGPYSEFGILAGG